LSRWRRQETGALIGLDMARRSFAMNIAARLIRSIIVILLRTPQRNHVGQ
jgi:hypothetical protein